MKSSLTPFIPEITAAKVLQPMLATGKGAIALDAKAFSDERGSLRRNCDGGHLSCGWFTSRA